MRQFRLGELRSLATTEHFEVFGLDGQGFKVGLSCYQAPPETPSRRPYVGYTCITYTELDHVVTGLIGELRDLLRQVDQHPAAGMLMRRGDYQPHADSDPTDHRGLALRFAVFKRDNYRCQICGRCVQDGTTLEVDHRIPRAKGGSDNASNLWTLCFECNRGKSDTYL